MEAILYPMPNATACTLLPAAIRDDPTIFPQDQAMGQFNIMSDLGEYRRLIQNRWERLQAE
jgi:hypothetical protein